MLRTVEKKIASLLVHDVGNLILRAGVGFLILFHGVHKAVHGIDGIKFLVTKASLPEFIAYGVYFGEIVFPILIILGLFTRIASLSLAFNMLVAILLAYGNDIFSLGKMGGLTIELPLIFLLSSLTIAFIGAGKYSVDNYKS